MVKRNLLFTAFMFLILSTSQNVYANNNLFNNKGVHLLVNMRKLWEDHIVYTRNFIISAIANLEDQSAVIERLLSNQDDIGNAFKPYYGDMVGNKLAKLLREHIALAGAVVVDAIANDMPQFEQDYQDWKDNAKEIAKFLSKQNPNWSKNDLKEMLYKHLELTTGEVTSRLSQDWEADISFYDINHLHMLMFSDVLTGGIIKQFPSKF